MKVRAACLLVFCLHAGNVSAQVVDGHPAWSPVDNKIAFERFQDGRSEVPVLDLGAQRVSSVEDPEQGNDHPAWSPDGRYLAFASKRDDGGLHLADLASGEVTVLLPRSAVRPAARPSWSPDGTELAFHARIGDAREIFTLHLEDRSVRRSTDNDSADTAPHWWPDGERILFSSKRDGGKRELYVMDADGRQGTRLTHHEADDADASWSPTGDRVVFYSDRSGAYRLWLANLRTHVTERVPY